MSPRPEDLLRRLLAGVDDALPAPLDDAARRRLGEELTIALVRTLFVLMAQARGHARPAPGAPGGWARMVADARAWRDDGGPLFEPLALLDGLPIDDATAAATLAGLARRVPEGEEALGALYESLIGYEIERTPRGRRLRPGQARRRRGSFYTPPALTARVVASTLGPLLVGRDPAEALALRICDPAMGSGAFLLQAVRAIADAAEPGSAPSRVADARRLAAERCVFGVDRDPIAVELARLSLWLLAGAGRPVDFAAHLKHGDALLGLTADRFVAFHWRPDAGPVEALRAVLDAGDADRATRIGDLIVGACLDHRTDEAREAARRARLAAIAGPLPPDLRAAAEATRAEHHPFHWPVGLPDAGRRGFDAIVGNPPYRAGRHAGLARLRPLLRGLFPTAEYQLDPYLLFLDRAIRLTRPGGRVGLLVPNAWMSNHRTGRLRALMVGDNRLDHVVEVPVEAFDAQVETVIVALEVGRPTAEARVPLRDPDGARTGTLLVDVERPERPIALARSDRAIALLEASRAWTTTVGDIARVTRGINPYHHTTHTAEQIAARVHHADHRVDDGWSPDIRGRHLTGPYRLEWPGDTWIHYGPWLKEPRDPAVFTGRRLLVRKIIGETLHGVLVDGPAYCDQSVYIARFFDDQPYDPWAVLACVNSRLMATLVKALFQEDDRLFPQLKVGELRALPLPAVAPDDARWAELAALAALAAPGGADARDRIEARVGALYGVSAIG